MVKLNKNQQYLREVVHKETKVLHNNKLWHTIQSYLPYHTQTWNFHGRTDIVRVNVFLIGVKKSSKPTMFVVN